MSRDEIISANPIADFVRSRGHELKRAGENFVTSGCPATQHKRGHRPVMIYPRTQSWNCHDCKVGGSVIDWFAKEKGISGADALRELAGGHNGSKPSAKLVKTYDYTDDSGHLLYQVCRYVPKNFKQRCPGGGGDWIWNTTGVERVLFRLPEITQDIAHGLPVFVCEGEKDVLDMAKRGFSATCNPGGAGKWQDSYSETLRGADVIIVADKDKSGREHAQDVAFKLRGAAKFVRVIELPDINGKTVKDAADFFAAGGDLDQMQNLVDHTPEWKMPVETPANPPKTAPCRPIRVEPAASADGFQTVAGSDFS